MELGKKVRNRREQLNMSQEELAQKLGYKSRSSVNKIENGRPCSQKIISRLADALSVSVPYLMGWEDEQAEKTDAKSSMDELQKALMSQDAILFDGEPIDDETRDLLLISLRNTMELAEKLSKNRKG